MVKCNGCGRQLHHLPDLPDGGRQPCPDCGSTARLFEETLTESVRLYASLRLQQKRRGVKGYLVDLFAGWQRRASVGDMVAKDRIIDREQDRYRERIATEDGVIIHEVDEPLSSHRGHGSAKLNRR